MRVNENKMEFSNFRFQIGNGKYPLINHDTDKYSIEIQLSFLSNYIIKDIFGDIIFNLDNVSTFSRYAIIATYL